MHKCFQILFKSSAAIIYEMKVQILKNPTEVQGRVYKTIKNINYNTTDTKNTFILNRHPQKEINPL